MDSVKLVPLLVGLLIAVVMVGAVFVPVVQSSTTRTITTEIENEGSEWLKLGYNQGTDYSFTVGFDGEDNFTVGTQTGEYKNLICYADNERTLFVSGDYWYLLTTGESSSVYKFTDNASVTNASGTLTILDGSETVYTGASPTWAYVPDANGVYGFFTEGGLNLEEGKPKVAVGSYAGVFAYNETVVAPNDLGTLGLTMSGDYADGEVIWMVAPSELDTLNELPSDTLEPAVIDLDPISIQPIDLGGSDSVGLMAVPTPTYTDGVWGFDNTQYGTFIVSYSGPGGDIVIPTTVSDGTNTYTVDGLGKTGTGNNMIDNASISPGSTITIPDTVHIIRPYVFNGCSNLTGDLIIPEGVNSSGERAYYNCGFDHLVLPSTMMFIENSAFAYTPFEGTLVIPESIYRVGMYAFQGTNFDSMIVLGTFDTSASSMVSTSFAGTNIKEVLNFGNSPITTTYYGLNADSVQDHVTALGYIAPTLITETEVIPIDSPVAGLMQLLPLIAGIGALFLAVGTMIYTRF